MVRFFLFNSLVLFLCQFSSVFSEHETVTCAPELQKAVTKILQLPEARALVTSIQREGFIKIVTDNRAGPSQQFGAYWDPSKRTIKIGVSSDTSEGKIIGSILFELHNALVNSKLEHAYFLASTGRMGKKDFVETIERLEYNNSIAASKLIERGIRLGIYPLSARLFTYKNFEEHLYYQIEGGHSDYIAKNYDKVVPKRSKGNESYIEHVYFKPTY